MAYENLYLCKQSRGVIQPAWGLGGIFEQFLSFLIKKVETSYRYLGEG